MPIPDGFDRNLLMLHHVAGDGSLTHVPFTISADRSYIIFERNQLSVFALVQRTGTVGETSGENETGETDNGRSRSPQTGDDLSLASYLLLAISSLGLITGILVKKKRES